MGKRNYKKLLFGGLLLTSAMQIVHHFMQISDFTYGGLTGIALGIMFIGLFKMINLKSSTSK